MAFVKLFSTITESSLWSQGKDTRLLFVTMLAKADQTGFVEASLPGLARVANLTLQETEAALSDLEGPDKHSKNPDHDGRRVARMEGGWLILNYTIYRERRNDEERQAYMRDYMKRYRAESVNKRKQMLAEVNHGKPRLAQAEAEAEAEAEAQTKTGARKRAQRGKVVDNPPSLEDVQVYVDEIGGLIPASEFMDANASRGWTHSKGQYVVDWKAHYRAWNARRRSDGPKAIVCPHPAGSPEAMDWWVLGGHCDEK
jgi:hypothetical protein